MEQRTNIDYIITDSIRVGETEFVLGEHRKDPNRFVTWECKHGTDYYWGHYLSSRKAAEKDLVERATHAMRFREDYGQMTKKNKHADIVR